MNKIVSLLLKIKCKSWHLRNKLSSKLHATSLPRLNHKQKDFFKFLFVVIKFILQ